MDRSGREVAIREEPDVIVNGVSLSPDGRFLTWSRKVDADNPTRMGVKIWDIQRGELVQTLPTPGARVEFDPSGRWLASAEMDEARVEIFDAKTYEPVTTLVGRSAVRDVAFTADVPAWQRQATTASCAYGTLRPGFNRRR